MIPSDRVLFKFYLLHFHCDPWPLENYKKSCCVCFFIIQKPLPVLFFLIFKPCYLWIQVLMVTVDPWLLFLAPFCRVNTILEINLLWHHKGNWYLSQVPDHTPSQLSPSFQVVTFRCKHGKKRAEWLVMQELNYIPVHLHFHSSHRPTSSSDGSHRAVVPKSLSHLVRDLFGDTVRPVVDTLLVFDAPRSMK